MSGWSSECERGSLQNGNVISGYVAVMTENSVTVEFLELRRFRHLILLCGGCLVVKASLPLQLSPLGVCVCFARLVG